MKKQNKEETEDIEDAEDEQPAEPIQEDSDNTHDEEEDRPLTLHEQKEMLKNQMSYLTEQLESIEVVEKQNIFFKEAPKRIAALEIAVKENRLYLLKLRDLLNALNEKIDLLLLSKK